MIARYVLYVCLAAAISVEARMPRPNFLRELEDISNNVIEKDQLNLFGEGTDEDFKFGEPRVCQIEEVRKIDGHCSKVGARGTVACIAGDIIVPFHNQC